MDERILLRQIFTVHFELLDEFHMLQGGGEGCYKTNVVPRFVFAEMR